MSPSPIHVEVHVNGYAVELCGDEVTIYELGTRKQVLTANFIGGRLFGLSGADLDLSNEHGANWQNYLAIEEHLRFAVEHSGVE